MKINLRRLQIGFTLKLISRKAILKWSDKNILNGTVDNVFIELSSILSNDDDSKITEILERYSSNLNREDFYSFHQYLMCFIFLNIKDWKSIHRKLIVYYVYFKYYLDNDDFEFWSRLKDDYQLRRDDFTGCMQMPKELKKYLKSFNCTTQNNDNTFFFIINGNEKEF